MIYVPKIVYPKCASGAGMVPPGGSVLGIALVLYESDWTAS